MKKAVPPTPTDPIAVGEAATPVTDVDSGASDRNPWWYTPSLYFMQGVPVVAVQMLSVTMYKKMGVSNAEIGLWTSLIAWPWIAKMLWGPLVEGYGTRRSWIVVTQALIIAGLGLVAFGITQTAFLALTLAIFFVVAFLSATHDIAADGYYLLALKERDQAFFVGIRSASFRLAMIFGTGLLVGLAGSLELEGMPIPRTWMIALSVAAIVYGLLYLYNLKALPKPAADKQLRPVDMPRIFLSFGQVLLMLFSVFLIGRMIVIGAGALNPVLGKPVFTKSVELTPLFVEARPEHTEAVYESRANELLEQTPTLAPEEAMTKALETPKPFVSRDFTLPYSMQLVIALGIIFAAFLSTKKLFENIGMAPAAREYFARDRIVAILAFILFYRFGESMIGKMSSPFLLDPVEKGGLGVQTQAVGVIIGTVGVLGLTIGGLLGGWVIAKHGIKKSLWPMVLSLNIPNLFYIWLAFTKPTSPLSEKIVQDSLPFAHIAIEKTGQGALDWLIDFLVNIPSQIYNLFLLLYESIKDPVGQVIIVDQFGYGFGFAAYMVYLMFISQGAKYRTSNYAISTGLMALGAMFAGILSGYLQQFFAASYGVQGYAYFFVAVVVCTVPGMLTLFFIPMDREDLKIAPVDID